MVKPSERKSKRERLQEALNLEDKKIAKKQRISDDLWYMNNHNLTKSLLDMYPDMTLDFHSVCNGKIKFQSHHNVNIQRVFDYFGQRLYRVYCDLDVTHTIFKDNEIKELKIQDITDDLQFEFIRMYNDTYF